MKTGSVFAISFHIRNRTKTNESRTILAVDAGILVRSHTEETMDQLRIGAQVIATTLPYGPATFDNDHMVSELKRSLNLLLDENNRHFAGFRELRDCHHQLVAYHRCQPLKRLVQQEK